MSRNPRTGEFYRDDKGLLYQVVTEAVYAGSGETLTVYQCLSGSFQVYAAAREDFLRSMKPARISESQEGPVGKPEFQKGPISEPKSQKEPVMRSGPNHKVAAESESQNGPAAESGSQSEPIPVPGFGEEPKDSDSPGLNPLLISFAEEEDFGKRLVLFKQMRGKLTRQELEIVCEILDLFQKDGDMAQQEEAVENYLKMQKKFDGTRLR